MPELNRGAAFLRDKTQFFSQLSSVHDNRSKFQVAENRSETIDYTFLLDNLSILQTEFTKTFKLLQEQDESDNEFFWFWCYYCACNLEAFHQAYSQNEKAMEYTQIKQKIKDRLNGTAIKPEPEPQFIQSLYDSFSTGFANLATSPLHISRIRDYVGYSNLCRIYWAFSRLTMTAGLKLAKDVGLIEKLDAMLGTHTDVGKIISVFEIPITVLNYCSVGFFLMRLTIDSGLLLLHTFKPTELAKGANKGRELNKMASLPDPKVLEEYRNSYILVQEKDGSDITLYYIPSVGDAKKLTPNDHNQCKDSLLNKMKQENSLRLTAQEIKELITAQTGHVPEITSYSDRFKHDFYKRHCNYANDLVWATVNFLSNFNYLFGISGPAAGYLTAAFLTFDVCMALYKCHLAEKEYIIQRDLYLQEIADYTNPDKFKGMSQDQRQVHINMINKQLKELEIDLNIKKAKFYYSAAGAALLTMGFTAAILVSSPILVVASFFTCVVAVATYLSTDAYTKYKEKSLYLEQAMKDSKVLPEGLKEFKEFEIAKNDFRFTMLKNTVMPMMLITTCAICWPAAIALTVLYLGSELNHAYSQYSDTKAVKQLENDSRSCSLM